MAAVAASGKAVSSDTKPHSTLLPYAELVPYSKRQSLTGAPLGFTDAYRAAELRVTEAAPSVRAVGAIGSTANVIGALCPLGFSSELACVATAVYSPHCSGAMLARAEAHLPPVPGAVALATFSPAGLVPLKISTVTCVSSLAVPENDGVVSFDGDGGASSVTVGASVSTTNLTGMLLPAAFLISLACVATA